MKISNETFQNETIQHPITRKLKLPNPVKVECRRDGLKSKGIRNECHANIAKMVYRYGGSQVVGLLVTDNSPEKDLTEYIAHSVWMNPEGRLVCLTLGHKYPQINFVPLFVYNQEHIKKMFQNDYVGVGAPLSFIANARCNWIVHNDEYEKRSQCVDILMRPRKVQNISFPKIVKDANRQGFGDCIGNPKFGDIRKSIIKQCSNGNGIDRIFMRERCNHKSFLPDVVIPYLQEVA